MNELIQRFGTHFAIFVGSAVILGYILPPDTPAYVKVLYLLGSILLVYTVIYTVKERYKLKELIKYFFKIWIDLFRKGIIQPILLIVQSAIWIILLIAFLISVYVGNKIFESVIPLVTWLSLAQLLACSLLIYHYVSHRKFTTNFALKDIQDENLAKHILVQDEDTLSDHFNNSKSHVLLIQKLWFFLLIFWVLFYTTNLFVNSSIVTTDTRLSEVLMRTLNIANTIIFLLFFSFFRSRFPIHKYTVAGNQVLPLIKILGALVVLDIVLYFSPNWDFYQTLPYLVLLGSALSSFAFLAFFGKLDSHLIRIPQSFLIILILYGLLQSVIPFAFLGQDIGERDSVLQFILVLSVPIMFLGKLAIGYILISPIFAKRQMIYFTRIFIYNTELE